MRDIYTMALKAKSRNFIAIAVAVAVAVVSALVLPGCNKKETDDGLDAPKPPAKKAADIFDEFYMDEEKPAAKKADAGAPPPPPPPPSRQQAGAPPARAAASGGSYSFNPQGIYVVQVNSTAMRGGAEKMANKLKSMGFPAYVAEVENPTPELVGLYFRVRIGGFNA
jgi:cell division septation protein DedD